jgi:hypothetical protein
MQRALALSEEAISRHELHALAMQSEGDRLLASVAQKQAEFSVLRDRLEIVERECRVLQLQFDQTTTNHQTVMNTLMTQHAKQVSLATTEVAVRVLQAWWRRYQSRRREKAQSEAHAKHVSELVRTLSSLRESSANERSLLSTRFALASNRNKVRRFTFD